MVNGELGKGFHEKSIENGLLAMLISYGFSSAITHFILEFFLHRIMLITLCRGLKTFHFGG